MSFTGKVTHSKKLVQFVVAVGVARDLEQRLEDVAQELLEVVHDLVRLEDIAVREMFR